MIVQYKFSNNLSPTNCFRAFGQIGRPLLRVKVALLCALVIGSDVFAAAGDFDTSFAQGGIVRFSGDPTLPVDGQATSVITDDSGKLLVTGFDNLARTGIFARIFANGALDTALAGKGFIVRPPGPQTSRREATQAFPVANGGTLLIESSVGLCFGSPGGCSISGGFDPSFGAIRIGLDGVIDPNYSGVLLGSRNTNIVAGKDGSLTAMDVKSPILGRFFFLARYDSNGLRDPLFDQDAVAAAINCGTVYSPVPPSLSTAPPLSMKIARQSNSRLLVAQQLKHGVTQSNDICIVRLNQDGTRDTSFGNAGQIIISDPGLANHFPFKLLVRNDGGINVLLLNGPPKIRPQPAMIWLTETGAIDTTRGSLGITNPIVAAISSISAATLQTDDKILFAGYGASPGTTGVADESDPKIARQDARGVIDFGFGPFRGGYANLYAGTTRFAPNDVFATSDGAIYLAGGAGDRNLATPTAMAVAKLLGDPAPVPPASNNGGGGGGCFYTRNGPFDPTLPAAILVAVWYLFGRRRATVIPANTRQRSIH